MLKIFRAHLRTAGKTVEDIKKMYDGSDGQEPSKEEIQRYINVLNSLEGLEVLVFDRSHLGESDYGLYLWKKEDGERIRELFYEAEQDHMSMSVMILLKIGKQKFMILVLFLHLMLMI